MLTDVDPIKLLDFKMQLIVGAVARKTRDVYQY